jgi:hypothetical protein
VRDEHGGQRKKSLPATEWDSERVSSLLQQQVEAIAARTDVGRFSAFSMETGLRLTARGAMAGARADGAWVGPYRCAPLPLPNADWPLVRAWYRHRLNYWLRC